MCQGRNAKAIWHVRKGGRHEVSACSNLPLPSLIVGTYYSLILDQRGVEPGVSYSRWRERWSVGGVGRMGGGGTGETMRERKKGKTRGVRGEKSEPQPRTKK